MTRRALSDSLYQRLTPQERYRLAIEAYARADVDEFRRLSDTGAVARYWCADPEYTGRLVASFIIALAAANFLAHACFPIVAAVAAKKARAEASESEANAPSATAPEVSRPRDESSRLEQAERVAVIVSVCEGITRFCDEIAVLPLRLLTLEPSCLPFYETFHGVDTDLCNDEISETVYERLSSIWASLVPGDADRAQAA
jgi:hypothetical protein